MESRIRGKIREEARSLPLYECRVNASWQEGGLAIVVVSRQQGNGRLSVGCFLVDVFCLGLKNTLWQTDLTVAQYQNEFVPKVFGPETPVACTPALAHRIIYGGIDYAARFGFKPHPDFDLSQFLLDDPATANLGEAIAFGKDGKPFFIAGPDDDAAAIIHQLEATAGAGNYHFLYPLQGM